MHSKDNIIDETAKVYRDVRLRECTIGAHCSIADDCDLYKVVMEDFSELGRRSLVRKASLGRGSYTGSNAIIKNAKIGKYCSLAWNISIGGWSHDYSSASTYTRGWWKKVFGVDVPETRTAAPFCSIGNDVWIGAGANIVSGVTIGDGAVIAAGAVVVKDVEPYTVVAGVPAKPIRRRFDDEVANGLVALRWWDWEPSKIARAASILNKSDFDVDDLALLQSLD